MDLYEIITKYKKAIVIIFIALVALVIALTAFYTNKNPYGDQVVINNLSQYTQGKNPDKDTLHSVQHSLFTMMQRNNTNEISQSSIGDTLIREGTYNQSHDEQTGKYDVNFIVDIPNLKQSYLVNYQWIEGDSAETIDQYGIQVSCLPDEQLTMGEFSCEDLASDMMGTTDSYILVNWYSSKDNYGNDVDSQLQSHEKSFIEGQVLGHFKQNNKMIRRSVNATIAESVKRNISGSNNSLSFTLVVDDTTDYEVFVDYNDGRYTRISNESTTIAERRTED